MFLAVNRITSITEGVGGALTLAKETKLKELAMKSCSGVALLSESKILSIILDISHNMA